MRSRVFHLAWLLVLLSSVSAADAGVRSAALGLIGSVRVQQLLEDVPASVFRAAGSQALNSRLAVPALSAAEASLRAAWTVRPPAAHALAIHAFTARRA